MDVALPNLVVVSLVDFAITVVSVYRPPSYTSDENALLVEFFREFLDGRELVILGDFNLPSLKWPLDDHGEIYVSPVDRDFRDCFVELGWSQWVDFGTFFPSGNTLDLVFTSDADRVVEVSSCSPFPGCHHTPVLFGFVFQWDQPINADESIQRLDWAKANYEAFNSELLEFDW